MRYSNPKDSILVKVSSLLRLELNQHKEAFIKQQYALGYRAEFDFGEVKLKISGELKKVTGVYGTIVYDNMRNIIKKFIGRNEKELNDALVKLAIFYGFTPIGVCQ